MTSVEMGILVAVALALALLVPYLFEEIKKGKKNRAQLPIGASEPNPGTRGNPAPGHPDAQSDPYSPRASR